MATEQKILIIEDDTFINRIYKRVFSLSGFGIELAQNGEEAMAKMESMNPAPTLIILDIMIPKISGFEVLKRLKGDVRWQKIPVIVMTNLSEKTDEEKALNLGASLYLVKSDHNPREVVLKAKELIDKQIV
ncbi:MAG: two-component system, OmpR family, phosphate regulon response regulator PhoB [Parcubacteria bacterium C7867-006]|nr:MAG: two-component system, OmpR family, phosphate regulon response regulator PhoB [Parcubacteria bacterium C7867-006]